MEPPSPMRIFLWMLLGCALTVGAGVAIEYHRHALEHCETSATEAEGALDYTIKRLDEDLTHCGHDLERCQGEDTEEDWVELVDACEDELKEQRLLLRRVSGVQSWPYVEAP